jgi:hypothetical protein
MVDGLDHYGAVHKVQIPKLLRSWGERAWGTRAFFACHPTP